MLLEMLNVSAPEERRMSHSAPQLNCVASSR